MSDLIKKLQGYKTYLTAVAVFVVGGLQAAGKLDPETAQQLLAFLGGLGLITLRAAVAKAE